MVIGHALLAPKTILIAYCKKKPRHHKKWVVCDAADQRRFEMGAGPAPAGDRQRPRRRRRCPRKSRTQLRRRRRRRPPSPNRKPKVSGRQNSMVILLLMGRSSSRTAAVIQSHRLRLLTCRRRTVSRRRSQLLRGGTIVLGRPGARRLTGLTRTSPKTCRAVCLVVLLVLLVLMCALLSPGGYKYHCVNNNSIENENGPPSGMCTNSNGSAAYHPEREPLPRRRRRENAGT